MTKIHMIAEDIWDRTGKDDNLLGALDLMFDKEKMKKSFPWRIKKVDSTKWPENPAYRFNTDYASHLTVVMMLTSEALNSFLEAAENQQSFSFRASKYYEGRSFEELLYKEWPVWAELFANNQMNELLHLYYTNELYNTHDSY